MRRAALMLVPIGLILLCSTAYAERYGYYSQLVKTHKAYQLVADDGYLMVSYFNCQVDSFTPEARTIQISPLSGDPGVRTASPISWDPYWTVQTSTGQLGMEIFFTFNSLRDVGLWSITCDGTHSDPAYCVSQTAPPGFSCDIGATTDWNTPYTFFVTVSNQPGTANISVSGTPKVGNTITLNSGARDPDHPGSSGLRYEWAITSRPPGSVANLSSTSVAAPTITIASKRDIGNWTVELRLTDVEGELTQFTHNFEIENQPPTLNIAGARTVNTTQSIHLEAGPATDADGETVSWVWDILSAPPGAQHLPQENFSTAQVLDFETGIQDIGTWQIKCTASDDHNPPVSVDETVTVNVQAIPPTITLTGNSSIKVGDTIHFETTTLNDAYGEPLQFRWDILQAPASAGDGLLGLYGTGSGITIPTGAAEAGTWRIKLTVTDQASQTATKPAEVVVDAAPTAVITGPDLIGSLSFPLELKANDSLDPDSPCPEDPDRCHNTLEPPVRGISPGIDFYHWSLIDVPYELRDLYPPGSIDEVFGVPAHSSTMVLDYGDLEPGDWTFQLEVHDGEGNQDITTIVVTVADENGPPFAILNAPARYIVDISSIINQDITLSGALSFDLDNLLAGDALGPGIGITNYKWRILDSPDGCHPPTLPSGPNEDTVKLYTAGMGLEPTCQGIWNIGMTATDDDSPALTDSANTPVIIENCPDPLCVDYPTRFSPHFVEFTPDTDILIYYHLNSTLYDALGFASGLFVKLEIFHEDDMMVPVYEAIEPNVLATDEGGFLVFHWNGYSSSFERPQPGLYTIQINLLDADFNTSTFAVSEPNSILIAVAEPIILPTSDKYINYQELITGAENLSLSYKVAGGVMADELLWRVYDATDSVISERPLTSAMAGTIEWNGLLADDSTVSPGSYAAELEAYKAGASIGLSEPHTFVVYELSIDPITGLVPGTPPRLFVFANTDDDNQNYVSDLSESIIEEDDIIELNLSFKPNIPAAITVSSDGSSPPPFKIWNTIAKETEINLPVTYETPDEAVPAALFIEGQTAGTSVISIEAVTDDSAVLGPHRVEVVVPEMLIKGADGSETYHVNIARWDNAYDDPFPQTQNPVTLKNTPDPDDFIYEDPSRFYIHLNDPSAEASDHIIVQIGTDQIGTEFDDDMTDISLAKAAQSSGEFVSQSQLLTSLDIQDMNDENADDNIPVWVGNNLLVQDDQPGDRTHRADMDGQLLVQYSPNGSSISKEWRLPVCRRAPDERKKVQLRVHVFLEPYQDIGYDHDGNTIGAGDGVFSFTDLNMNGHDPGEPSEPFDDQNGNGYRDVLEPYQDVGYDHDGRAPTPDIGAGDGIFSYTDLNGSGHDVGEPSEPYRDISHIQSGSGFYRGDGPYRYSGRGPVLMRDNYVEDEIVRANIAWAPACIRFELLDGEVLVEEAPEYQGKSIIADGNILTRPVMSGTTVTAPSDLKVIFDTYRGLMTEDIVDVFYAASPGANGMTVAPVDASRTQEVGNGEIRFIVLAPMSLGSVPMPQIHKRVLAHELGHVLTNRLDDCKDHQYFFPQEASGTRCPNPAKSDDSVPNNYRRIDEDTMNDARTLLPSGADSNSRGNRVLKDY